MTFTMFALHRILQLHSPISHLNLPNLPHATPNLSGRNISDYLPSLVTRSNRKWLLRPRRRWHPLAGPQICRKVGNSQRPPRSDSRTKGEDNDGSRGFRCQTKRSWRKGRRSSTLQGVNMAVAVAVERERAQNGRRRKRFFSPDDQEVFVDSALPIGRRRRERSLLDHR